MKLRAETLPLNLPGSAVDMNSWAVRCRQWVVALLAVAVAFAVRWVASPWLGNELPFFGFIAASLLAAWYGGAVIGVSALLAGLFLGEFFFTGPGQGFGISD